MSADDDGGGDCLCESCSNDRIEDYLTEEDPFCSIIDDVMDENLAAIAALEYFPPRHAVNLVDEGIVAALLDLVENEVDAELSPPSRPVYYALRAATMIIRGLPDTRAAFLARRDFALTFAALLARLAEIHPPMRDQSLATILCCTLDALWPKDTHCRQEATGSDKLRFMNDDGKKLREALFQPDFPKRFVFARLFAAVSKPRAFCAVERSLMSAEASCLHNRALSTLSSLFQDEHHENTGTDLSCRRVVLREVPSALAIIMAVIRDDSVPDVPICHALYVMRELLIGEESGGRAVRELMRLAPDATRCFIDILFRADALSAPPLLDILYTICSHGFAVQEDVELASRVAGFGDMAVLLLKEEPGTTFVHKAACVLIQAAADSTEACFVSTLIASCVAELGMNIADMLPARFQSPLACRVATESAERLLVYKGAGGGGCSAASPSSAATGNSASNSSACDADWGENAGRCWLQHAALSDKWRNHRCEFCGSSDKDTAQPFKYCQGCHRSHFCSTRHQRAAWSHGHHKYLCHAFRRLTEQESLPSTVTHRSGDEGPPLESDYGVCEYVDLLACRAAKAGVPASAILIVVDMPAPLQNSLARRRAEEMPIVEHDLGPARIRVSWETCFDWVGMHRSRVMSFEMDLDSFPTVKKREAAIMAEERWSDRMRRSWWDSSPEERAVDSSGSCADAGTNKSEAGGSSHNGEKRGSVEPHSAGGDAASSRNAVASDRASPDYVATKREYRVAWWEWAESGRRKVTYTHCRIPNNVSAPLFSLNTEDSEEEVD